MSGDALHVLLVEDNPGDADLVREALEEEPTGRLRLTHAAALGEALALLGGPTRFDAVLLDLSLPDSHGLDTLRRVLAAAPALPVVVLTGLTDEEAALEAVKEGAQDYLVKGQIGGRLLHRCLRYALERHRAEQALRQARDQLEERVAARTAELREANARLEEADRRKDEFLAMLAHELRNPLFALSLGLQVTDDPAVEPGRKAETRDMLARQVRHLSRMVDDLLDVARLVRGQTRVGLERLDLARLVRTAAGDQRASLEKAGLSLHVQAPQTPLWVMGDAARLVQVLNNLLDNAGKYSRPGGRVEVVLHGDGGRNQAVLSVRDTGEGMSAETLGRLWQPLSQADRSLDRPAGGLGLGLAVVKGLVELHHGEVSAASAGLGRGAELTVRLPLAGEPAALAEVPASAPRAARRLRVLVVEDCKESADMLRMLLEVLGHEARVAYTGPDGVRVAREWRPELVLCDIGLPGLDGYGVARALRADPATTGVRLLAVTGYGGDEDRRRSREAGFDRHLTKPVAPETLLQVLAGEEA